MVARYRVKVYFDKLSKEIIKFVRVLLLPFSLVYAFVVWLRNTMFDLGVFKARRYDFSVICVGNIKAGGTGKSPLIEYLIRLLMPRFTVSVLSRGYGRTTTGLVEAGLPAESRDVGDEPAQFKNKFPEVTVLVSGDRQRGLAYLASKQLHRDERKRQPVVLLDDAFQHRWVKAGLNVVLLEYDDVFHAKHLFPAGNYREGTGALRRANAVVITKVKSPLSQADRLRVHTRLGLNAGFPLFFSMIIYLNPELLSTEPARPDVEKYFYEQPFNEKIFNEKLTIILITGIANPEPLIRYLNRPNISLIHYTYPDHHEFKPQEIRMWVKSYQHVNGSGGKLMLTTEKDAQRLKGAWFESDQTEIPLYYIPIRTEMSGGDFDAFILEYVRAAAEDRRIYT